MNPLDTRRNMFKNRSLVMKVVRDEDNTSLVETAPMELTEIEEMIRSLGEDLGKGVLIIGVSFIAADTVRRILDNRTKKD